MASAAALAMRLVQINLELGNGNISSKGGLFTPLTLLKDTEVPTLPNITFQYRTDSGTNMMGLFDMFLFALTPNVTNKSGVNSGDGNYNKIFNLIDVIRYPLILPHQRCKMNWPGDGNGPQHTSCLASPCDICKCLRLP